MNRCIIIAKFGNQIYKKFSLENFYNKNLDIMFVYEFDYILYYHILRHMNKIFIDKNFRYISNILYLSNLIYLIEIHFSYLLD